jgi:hypothetical protein
VIGTVIVALLCAAPLAACRDHSVTGKAAQAAMGGYAEGYNKLLEQVNPILDRYRSSFPGGPSEEMLDGKPGRKPHLMTATSMASRAIDEAKKAFQQASDAAPPTMSGAASAADETIGAAERVLALYSEAEHYYDAENYKEDKLARGKKLHADFVAAAARYRAGIHKLAAALDSIEDAQATAQLEKYEADKSFGYWLRKYTMEAKRFVNAVQAADTLEQLGGLAAAYKPLDELHAELGKFATSHGATGNTPFSSYVSFADRLEAESRKLLRAIKDATPDKGEPVGEAGSAVVQAYNNLVSTANSLYELEDAGGLK